MSGQTVNPNGEIIRQLRHKLGLKAKQLAEKAGLGARAISKAENFNAVNAITISLIANALGVPVETILIAEKPIYFTTHLNDKRKLGADGSCTIEIERRYRTVGPLEYIGTFFGKLSTPHRPMLQRPEIQVGICEAADSAVSIEYEPNPGSGVAWRFKLSPPLPDKVSTILLRYSFILPEWWFTSADSLQAAWDATPVQGSAKQFAGKESMGLEVSRYCRSLRFSVVFPTGIEISQPDLAVLSIRAKVPNEPAMHSLRSDNSFAIPTRHSNSLALNCSPPAPGLYYLSWIPAK